MVNWAFSSRSRTRWRSERVSSSSSRSTRFSAFSWSFWDSARSAFISVMRCRAPVRMRSIRPVMSMIDLLTRRPEPSLPTQSGLLLPPRGEPGWARGYEGLGRGYMTLTSREIRGRRDAGRAERDPRSRTHAQATHIRSVRHLGRPMDGSRPHVWGRRSGDVGLGPLRTHLPFLQCLAAHHQYDDHGPHLPHGLPHPEHAEPG